jgi:hypothetical protein
MVSSGVGCVVARLIFFCVEQFEFAVDVCDDRESKRTVEIVSSTTSWLALKDRLAKTLNMHPDSLHLQYRLSTDTSKSLPFDLTTFDHHDHLVKRLRPLIIPPRLANGSRSTRKRKPVSVQLFNKRSDGKGVQGGQGDSKVCDSP